MRDSYAHGMIDDELLIVLGSRSPQRRELLSHIIPLTRIEVRPPADANEPGFEDISDWPALAARLTEIARLKNDDVWRQLRADGRLADRIVVLTADTVIVGISEEGQLAFLGQPPDDEEAMRRVVRDWFRRYYLGRTHTAATAVCLTSATGQRREQIVRSEVTFSAASESWLEWYLATGEPRGKSGGYALQGAGDLFVERVDGGLSNVVGLPLAETLTMIQELQRDEC